MKGVGPLPGGGEGRDGPAAAAADGALVGIGREAEAVGPFEEREQLVEQEARVGVAEAVVFEAAVEAVEGVGRVRLHAAGRDEDADQRRDFLLGDQVVKNDLGPVAAAILQHHERGGLRTVELLREVHRVVAHRAGIHAVGPGGEHAPDALALGHARLRLGIGPGRVRAGAVRREERTGGQQPGQQGK